MKTNLPMSTMFQFGSDNQALVAKIRPPLFVTPSERFIASTRRRLLRLGAPDERRRPRSAA